MQLPITIFYVKDYATHLFFVKQLKVLEFKKSRRALFSLTWAATEESEAVFFSCLFFFSRDLIIDKVDKPKNRNTKSKASKKKTSKKKVVSKK